MTELTAQWRAIEELRRVVEDLRKESMARIEFGQETRGLIAAHEQVCTERYKAIAESIKQINSRLWIIMIGMLLLAFGDVFGVPAMLRAFFKAFGVGI